MTNKQCFNAIAAASQREAEAHKTTIMLSKEKEELRMELKALLVDYRRLVVEYVLNAIQNLADMETIRKKLQVCLEEKEKLERCCLLSLSLVSKVILGKSPSSCFSAHMCLSSRQVDYLKAKIEQEKSQTSETSKQGRKEIDLSSKTDMPIVNINHIQTSNYSVKGEV